MTGYWSSPNSLNALATLLLFVVGGIVLLGHARKFSHDVLVQTAKDWQELAASRLAIIEGLQRQLDAIQAQITRHAERLTAMEHDNQELQRLNQRLQVRVERLITENRILGELLQRAGIPVPPDLQAGYPLGGRHGAGAEDRPEGGDG